MRNDTLPGLESAFFLNIIESGDVANRLKLAAQLTAFLIKPDTAHADREAIIPVILKLCVDPVKDVRKLVAENLSFYAKLHADIVFSIIADEDDVALPFLRTTPALNHWHMLAVLRVGDQARQICIANRSDISDEAVAHIVRQSPVEICLCLFKNRAVTLDEKAYQTLYERFSQSADMIEELLAQSNLPLDIRITQAKRASHRMRQLMAERGWVAVTEAAHLVEDAEETAILCILVEANDDELATAMSFLIDKKMLTSSLIVRAAAVGEMKVVTSALAHLAGISLARAHEMMFGRSRSGLKSLHGKAGLPASCLGLLQAACDVAKEAEEEGLPLEPQGFGHRVIEALMTRYEDMPTPERTKNLEMVGRFAEDRVRKIAKQLRADLVRAA